MFIGGFARLSRGTVFRNGYQSHAATETCPGHSTILTGSRSGADGNHRQHVGRPVAERDRTRRFIAPRTSACPDRHRSTYTVSPIHLRVPTLGDRMKAAWPGSRNVAVGGKDRSAVMMGGKTVDQRWYWDGKRFASDLAVAPPASVDPDQSCGRCG